MIERWQAHHKEIMEQMIVALNLPIESLPFVFELWNRTRLKAPRVPKSLIVDCIYIVAHMTGNRRSVRDVKDTAFLIINRRTRPLSQDRRSGENLWLNSDWAKEIILSIIPDEEALNDLLDR